MHMSHPPIEHERRVMYTGFGLPPRPGDTAPRNAADLSRVREQAYKTVNQAPGFVH